MTLNPDLVGFLAGELERPSGMPCGACGLAHASSAADWGGSAKRCGCKCCERYMHEWVEQVFREEYPDLIDRRGVITEAAIDEAICRIKRTLAVRL